MQDTSWFSNGKNLERDISLDFFLRGEIMYLFIQTNINGSFVSLQMIDLRP